MTERLDAVLSRFGGTEDELIPILQAVQGELGYLPEDAMMAVAEFTRVPESRVYGTACHVRGAPRILEEVERTLGIKEGETTEDLEYSLETVACIGCCGLSPALMVNGKVVAKMTPKKVRKLFGEKVAKE